MASQHHEMRKRMRKETETGIKNDTGIKTDIETRTLTTEIKNGRGTRTSIEIETNATKTGTEGKTGIENTGKDQGSLISFMKPSQTYRGRESL